MKGIEILGEKFSSDDSPQEFNRKSEKFHNIVGDLIKYKDATEEEKVKIAAQFASIQKALEGIEDAKLKASQALERATAAAASVPGGRLNGSNAEFIRSLSFGAEADEEFCKLARVQKIDAPYFNVISRTPTQIKSMGAPADAEAMLGRLRLVNDAILVLNKYFALRDSGTYNSMGGMKSLNLWPEWEALCKRVQFSDLAEGAASTGGAWVPTIWSGNLINLVQIMARFANYFETFPMQSQTQKGFVEGADTVAYLIAEAGAITQSDFTTFDATWVALKMAASAVTSRELNQDSAIPLTQEIERKMAKAIARGTENALINGQKTGTSGGAGSLDSGETIAASDIRMLCNGVRYWHAQTGLGVVDASSGLTIEAMAKLRGPMGAYGTDPSAMVWLCSAWGAAHILTVKNAFGQPILLGPLAAGGSPPGTIGTLLDSPIVMSAYVSDAQSAGGVIDGAGATTAIYYVNVDQFKIGERMGIVVDASPHVKFLNDQITFRSIRRMDFQPVRTPSASDPMVNAIGNLPLS